MGRYVAEFLGTAALLIAVVGSGISGAALSGGIDGVALMANAVATGCALFVLITLLASVSGAHFNPIVSLAFHLRGDLSLKDLLAFCAVQVLGGIVGVLLTHAMFDLSLMQTSTTLRFAGPLWISEVLAAFGLVYIILAGVKRAPAQIPAMVALYITGAYWFTASTSFANPAVTIARSFTDTFAGIAPNGVIPFIICQLIGMAVAVLVVRLEDRT